MSRSIGIVFTIVVATFGLLPFGGATKVDTALAAGSKVVISFAGVNPRQTPLWIAQEQALFAKHGVDVDVVFIRTGPIQVAAVSSGATQMAILARRRFSARRAAEPN